MINRLTRLLLKISQIYNEEHFARGLPFSNGCLRPIKRQFIMLHAYNTECITDEIKLGYVHTTPLSNPSAL